MKDINGALAPSGATHEYNGMWRKFEGGKWFAWLDGEWIGMTTPCPREYEPIPEREIELNRLADTVIDNYNQRIYGFTWTEWHKRRTERIEAGLIKENNDLADVSDTDVVEIVDSNTLEDLLEKSQPFGLKIQANSVREWFEQNAKKPEPKEWINDIPPAGERCEYRDERWYEDERFDECEFIGRRSNGELVVFSDVIGYREYSQKAVKFRPAKTAEQIATEKRDNEVDRMFKTLTIDNSNKAYKICQDLYDAGYRLTLEATKGGDI